MFLTILIFFSLSPQRPSAEHGIGQFKVGCLHMSKSDVAIGLMRQFKSVMDPKQILNPYKVLP